MNILNETKRLAQYKGKHLFKTYIVAIRTCFKIKVLAKAKSTTTEILPPAEVNMREKVLRKLQNKD